MRTKRKRDTLRSVNDKHTIELWDRMDAAFDALGDAIHATHRAKLINLFDKVLSNAEELVLQETRLKWLARHDAAQVFNEFGGKAVVAEGTLKGKHVRRVKIGQQHHRPVRTWRGKTLEDHSQRFKDLRYTPGWTCHKAAVELAKETMNTWTPRWIYKTLEPLTRKK